MRAWWVLVVVVGVWACVGVSGANKCRRQPIGSHEPKSPGDNSFKISISGNPKKYFPGEVYTVSLRGWRTQYSVQKFIAFLLIVEPSYTPVNAFGPHSVGTFQLYGDALTMHSEDCPNAVTQTSSIPKSEIQVLWTAPPAGSGCVTFRATVVETRDIWYMDEGELTKLLCEEVQESDDTQPEIIHECTACTEAKYEVTFEGLWSRHTHPKEFPTNEWLTHFSDIIGASHSADYRVWEYGGLASDGLRQVAEWGSTRALESELKRQSDHIRTIIKARGLWHPNVNGKTFAVFRVDNRHHLMSVVSMLGPSPDWIVGVSALELCLRNGSWLTEKTLNLYPWDSGTDSGVTYESANVPTIPRERIRRITSSYPNDAKSPFYDPTGKEDMKPLARLTITRQRVYEKSCSDPRSLTFEEDSYFEEETEDANRPECQVTAWTEWTACSVSCGKGLRMRSREYLDRMKASMMGCQRQMVEKEMCAAENPYCPDGGAFNDPLLASTTFDQRICATTEWSGWTPCSVSCGKGHRMRNRHYENRMGRKKCDKELVEKEMCMGAVPVCEHSEEEIISPECAVTQWIDWSPCTVTCGEGVTSRTRYHLVPTASQSGCNVETMQTRKCMGVRPDCSIDASEAKDVCMQEKEVGVCRGVFPRWYYDRHTQQCRQFTYGGCRGNRNNFDSYDECTRKCELNNENPGSPPPGPDAILGRLPDHREFSVVESRSYVLDRVDCMVTPWSEWGPCSTTCNRGFQERIREIKIDAQNGGKRCPRKLKRRKKCTNPKCNEGYGGLEVMSQHREEEVIENEVEHEVNHGAQEVNPRPHDVRHQAAGGEGGNRNYWSSDDFIHSLYEPEPSAYNPVPTASSYQPFEYIAPSLFNPGPLDVPARDDDFDDGTKADCVMGDWSPWSPCTHSCGTEALQQRSRNVIVSAKHGGQPCTDRYQRRYCTLPPCHHHRG